MIVVYHGDCIDGAAAAWTAGRALAKKPLYIPYSHSDKAGSENLIRKALKAGEKICFVDVTPEQPFLQELLAAGSKVDIFDHHVSAARQLKDYAHPGLTALIDPDAASTARMIWQHFFPQEKPPAVIDLINLMDGSGRGLSTPEDFAAAAFVDSKNISSPEKALKTLKGLAALSFNDMARKGRPAAAAETQRINSLLEKAAVTRLQILPGTAPVEIPIVHAELRHFGRSLSSRLAELGRKSGANVAFTWTLHKTGAVSVSIRTDGNPDASAIAAHLRATMGVTGGGHKDAAAVHFQSIAEFARWMPLTPAKPKPPAPPKPV